MISIWTPTPDILWAPLTCHVEHHKRNTTHDKVLPDMMNMFLWHLAQGEIKTFPHGISYGKWDKIPHNCNFLGMIVVYFDLGKLQLCPCFPYGNLVFISLCCLWRQPIMNQIYWWFEEITAGHYVSCHIGFFQSRVGWYFKMSLNELIILYLDCRE